jgi:PAS domain S-box-containing protein
MITDTHAEILRLRTALRDLVAISAIPAAGVGREPPDIAAGLADVLVRSLLLDFAFVRLSDPKGDAVVEVMRGNLWKTFPEWLQHQLAVFGQFSRKEIIPDVGGGMEPCRGVVTPIGVNAEGGLVAVACDRADFPTEIDQLLISVATNHAATAFQTARLIDERKKAEEEIRQARNELEIKVAERTKQLTAANDELRKENMERHRAEAALRESEELWRAVFENSAIGVALAELSGRFLATNSAYQKMLGYTEDEIRKFTSLELTHEDYRESNQELITELLEGNRKQFQIEKQCWRKDGSLVWVSDNVSLVPGSESMSRFIIALSEDITERKRAEEALRKAQAELAHVTRVTTLGEMAASIAHELNQPLGAIVNNASACLRWLAANNLEEVRRSTVLIIADGRRAGDIINRTRALAKKGPPRKDWLDINETILEVIALARSEAEKNHVLLQTQLSSDLPLILGDRIQLQQVILNLIINAIEAMSGADDDPREIEVGSTRDEPQGVVVTVRDSGPGLDPESLNRMFTAFYTTKPQGLGMGLAICRSIIDGHGGRLWATANAPHGAVFQFALPLGGQSLA